MSRKKQKVNFSFYSMAEIDESVVLLRQVTEQKKHLREVLLFFAEVVNNTELAKLLRRREYLRFKNLFDELIYNIDDLFKLTRDRQIVLKLDERILSLDTSSFIRQILPNFDNPIIKLFSDYLLSTYDSSNIKDKTNYLVEASHCHYLLLDVVERLTIFFGKSQKD
jgi:hypothetical protein